MSVILPEDHHLLQSLLSKVILYRFTRNIDKELAERKISHAELSNSTGRNSNWFNRTFNELEDIRLSTFMKLIVAVSTITEKRGKNNPIQIDSIITEEILEMTSVAIDLSNDDIKQLLHSDSGLASFFPKLKAYVDSMKGRNNVISQEEVAAYIRILELINQKERKNNG